MTIETSTPKKPVKPAPETPAQPIAAPAPTTPTSGPKLSALNKIRGQFAQADPNESSKKSEAIEQEALQNGWSLYTEKLRADKNSALPSFERARLEITGPLEFRVTTSNNIEQRFIEQERNALYELLTRHLQVPSLQFQVLVIAPEPGTTPDLPVTLSSRDQFQAMIANYPLVGVLKDKLGMDLDF